jgi:hypothetical protein
MSTQGKQVLAGKQRSGGHGAPVVGAFQRCAYNPVGVWPEPHGGHSPDQDAEPGVAGMVSRKAVVTDYVFESLDIERKALAAIGAELDVYQCRTPEELLPHRPGADALLNTYMPGVGPEVFHADPALKAVVRYGIGVDTHRRDGEIYPAADLAR